MNNQITITVSKDELLKIVKENRDSHHALYEKAWAGYVKQAEADLRERLDRIHRGKSFHLRFGYVAPEDHTADYEDVIDMLEMALGEEIELTQGQFKCYIKDDWGWKEQWTTSNTQYLS